VNKINKHGLVMKNIKAKECKRVCFFFKTRA